MKLKDVTESVALWSTPTGCLEARADVAHGVVAGPCVVGHINYRRHGGMSRRQNISVDQGAA